MTTRASGAGRKRNVVQMVKHVPEPLSPPCSLLSETAKEMWNLQSAVLLRRGTFGQEHAPLLVLYCNAWHYIVEADKAIANKASSKQGGSGLAIEGGSGGEKTNPVFAARNLAYSQFIRASSVLGLDPLSALRSPTTPRERDVNPFLNL